MQRFHAVRLYGKLAMFVITLLLLAGCRPVSSQVAAPQTESTTESAAATAEAITEAAGMMMGQGTMMHGSSDAPFDALFLDGMIMHHQGAIVMASQAISENEHVEVRQLAEAIVSAQGPEIAQMQSWRSEWYPDLAPTMGVGMNMGMMQIATDSATPFDQRFLQAMIAHHQGAIQMSTAALQQAEHPEVRDLAEKIIDAQQAEIEQMRAWLSAWYGVQ